MDNIDGTITETTPETTPETTGVPAEPDRNRAIVEWVASSGRDLHVLYYKRKIPDAFAKLCLITAPEHAYNALSWSIESAIACSNQAVLALHHNDERGQTASVAETKHGLKRMNDAIQPVRAHLAKLRAASYACETLIDDLDRCMDGMADSYGELEKRFASDK